MIAVACVLTYLVGYLPAARWFYIQFDESEPNRPDSNMGWAAFCALLWPVLLVFLAAKLTVFRETPRQRRERVLEERAAFDERVALDKLLAEKAAREYELPMPDLTGKETKGIDNDQHAQR